MSSGVCPHECVTDFEIGHPLMMTGYEHKKLQKNPELWPHEAKISLKFYEYNAPEDSHKIYTYELHFSPFSSVGFLIDLTSVRILCLFRTWILRSLATFLLLSHTMTTLTLFLPTQKSKVKLMAQSRLCSLHKYRNACAKGLMKLRLVEWECGYLVENICA